MKKKARKTAKKPIKKKKTKKPSRMKRPSKKVKLKKGKHIKIKKEPKLKKEPMASLLLPLHKVKEVFRTRYGFFLYDGSEYVITAPDSPTPWANIITNDNYGFIVTQTGGGFSFKKSVADRLTSWGGNINADKDGKFFYIRDNKAGNFWSATWNPVCKETQFYEVRCGIGYTNITSQTNDIISSLICFAAREEQVEIWQLRVRNTKDEPRNISIFSYVPWDFKSPERPFLKTSFDQSLSAVFAHTTKEEVLFHSVNKETASFTTDNKAFLGGYRDAVSPRSVEKGMCFKEEGPYVDPCACLHVDLDIEPKGERELIFIVGCASNQKAAQELVKKYKNIKEVENEFSRTGNRWGEYLKRSISIKTPDEGANILNNSWFRYQTISCGLSAKGCYYEAEGEVKLKDHLLNSLVFLPINSQITRENILKSVNSQYKIINPNEDPLWLIFAVCEYIKETADLSILKEKTQEAKAGQDTLLDHCLKLLEGASETIGKKGLQANRHDYCVWLGEFLCYLMDEFSVVCGIAREPEKASFLTKESKQLKDAINKLAKQSPWYPSTASIRPKSNAMFLNPQSWAVIAKLTADDNAAKLMDIVSKQLYKNHGPITVSAPYQAQDSANAGNFIGLPPGIKENGGTKIEFACWAVWAEAMLGRAHNAWEIYSRLNPVHRAHRADIYQMEPYVASCYIDGPDSAKFGQARNSWCGTAAFWLNKILTEQILGIKPTYKGLSIDPCIPKRWTLFKVSRAFRGTRYIIDVVNQRHVSSGIAEMIVDGKKVKPNILPIFKDQKSHYVRITMGKPA